MTSQYRDSGPDPASGTASPADPQNMALDASVYGGGCIDFGATGGFTCRFGDTSGAGAGLDYPKTPSCSPT